MGNLPPHRERRHRHCRSPQLTEFHGLPGRGRPVIARLRALPGQVFWEHDLSLVASDLVDVDQIMTPGQVTDAYLLALAVANKGQLATFDRRLSTRAVRRGRTALHVIDGRGSRGT
jgi:uncharacterized protein